MNISFRTADILDHLANSFSVGDIVKFNEKGLSTIHDDITREQFKDLTGRVTDVTDKYIRVLWKGDKEPDYCHSDIIVKASLRRADILDRVDTKYFTVSFVYKEFKLSLESIKAFDEESQREGESIIRQALYHSWPDVMMSDGGVLFKTWNVDQSIPSMLDDIIDGLRTQPRIKNAYIVSGKDNECYTIGVEVQ